MQISLLVVQMIQNSMITGEALLAATAVIPISYCSHRALSCQSTRYLCTFDPFRPPTLMSDYHYDPFGAAFSLTMLPPLTPFFIQGSPRRPSRSIPQRWEQRWEHPLQDRECVHVSSLPFYVVVLAGIKTQPRITGPLLGTVRPSQRTRALLKHPPRQVRWK